MAKVSAVEKNERRKRMHKKYAAKRAALKETIMNRELPIEDRFAAQLELASLPRNSARNRQRNRCALTGRPRAIHRKFKLSRIAIRNLASRGELPGVTKASW